MKNIRSEYGREQQSCEDCVSREAVIDEIEYELEMINSALDSIALDFNARERLRQRKGEVREILNSIQQLPSVTPQPKTGHWIRWYEQKENDGCIEHIPHCKCSECGKEYDPYSSQFVKYCNKCGAKMEEVEK